MDGEFTVHGFMESVDRSDGHQPGQHEAESKDEASEILVVTCEPEACSSRCEQQPELQCDSRVR